MIMESFDNILKFWFGRVEDTIVPTEHRARIWFGEDKGIDEEIRKRFEADLEKAICGQHNGWEGSPRGQLALIITLDQFARHIHRDTPLAFSNDNKALSICLDGIRDEVEHNLSLIERVFFYFPLLHSEDITHQHQAISAYQTLSELAFSETKVIYESFVKFSNHHYSIIERFGRFPQRNIALGRVSTMEELEYLQEIEAQQ